MKKPAIERWLEKVVPSETGECLLWAAGKDGNGYGQFWDGKRTVGAHTFGYEAWIGPIPEGLEPDHLCKTPGCVNPWCLEPVTHRVNILRSMAAPAINARKTQCIRGHEFTPENTRIDSKGARHCKTCEGAKGAIYREANREKENARSLSYYTANREQINARRCKNGDGKNSNASKICCPAGHPYDIENTYVGKSGKRYCRTCHRARTSADRARNKAVDRLTLFEQEAA